MAHPAGESESDAPRLNFDRRLKLEFHGSRITSDAGLLAYRELDDALGLSTIAGAVLADARRGKNGRHALVGMLRQSVFGRLAGYEDVNDAERLGFDPAMRWIVGGKAISGRVASASQMGRFETQWLTRAENLAAVSDLPGHWIDRVHNRRPPKGIVLDMDSSVSPTFGEQEGSAYNGHSHLGVADQAEGEADQDRSQGRPSRALSRLPDGRGRRAENPVRRNRAAYRRAATTTGHRASINASVATRPSKNQGRGAP
jgi:Transposase DDE domain group 1